MLLVEISGSAIDYFPPCLNDAAIAGTSMVFHSYVIMIAFGSMKACGHARYHHGVLGSATGHVGTL
jgi:hypothetical protein